MDLGQVCGPILEEQMLQTLLDQEILPLTATTSTDMEITSLACAEMSNQANLGTEFYLLGFGKDLQSNIIADITPGCAEHLISSVDDASVFQNLKHFCDSESIQEKSLMVASTNPSESHLDLAEKIPVPLSPVSPFSGKEVTELQQQDDLMEFFSLTTGQMDHCEVFHDLNLLLEQVATHDVESVNIPAKDEIFTSLFAAGSPENGVEGSQCEQVNESGSSEPPTKKQKTISSSVNENCCVVTSTQNETSNLTPENTHQKYMEMRRKNNIASRRSRQIRKEKDKALEATAVELENENRVLKEKAERLEKQRDALKNYLMTLITSRSSKA